MAMTDAQLRAKIRDLMMLGDLPNERPRVNKSGTGRRRLLLGLTSASSAASPDPTSPTSGVAAERRTYMPPAMRSGSGNEDS
jgi:hypothetical protein